DFGSRHSAKKQEPTETVSRPWQESPSFRAGSGSQCENSVGAILASAREQTIGLGGRFSAHLPTKPVPVGDLRDLDTVTEQPASEGSAVRPRAGSRPRT
ncbi:hypothetical protein ACWCQD_33250, partial [Streptomyces atratus]